jgi:hypothetical protein
MIYQKFINFIYVYVSCWIQEDNGILQQQNTMQPPVSTPPKRAIIGFALSLVATLIIFAQGIVRIFREALALLSDELRQRILAGLALQVVGLIAIIFAVLVMVGAYFIYSPGKETLGGIIVLVFAALSIITGGGWLVGLILGMVGGILGILKK